MDSTGQSLLKLLFNEGETICVSNNEFGFHSIPLKEALSGEIVLKSPNEKVNDTYCQTDDLILVAINPIKGFRRDENVTAFRSFLIEMDAGSIQDQIGTIKHLGMPFSAQVFSGNKSVHTVITLSEDLLDEKIYRYLIDWIFKIVTFADKNCANPSRSIRIPGSRRDNGKKQRLINIDRRITHKELMDWLNKYEHLQPTAKEKREVVFGEGDYTRLSPWIRVMLKEGMVFKNGRSNGWFSIACDFATAGYTEEKTIEILNQHFSEEHDFKEKEWLKVIESAFKYIGERRQT